MANFEILKKFYDSIEYYFNELNPKYADMGLKDWYLFCVYVIILNRDDLIIELTEMDCMALLKQ
jgi:hypothetical protein